MFEKLSQILIPIAGRLNNNRYLSVLRDAFMLSFPLTVFGSIIVVIINLPFLNDWMGADNLARLQELLNIAPNATLNIMTVFVVVGIGYYLSRSYKVEPIFGGMIALACFLMLTPFILTQDGGTTIADVIPKERLGAKGMFLGMIVAFIAGEIYRKVTQRNIVIKMPPGVPPAVAKSFAALLPACITLGIFLVINVIVNVTFHNNLHDLIYKAIQAPLVHLGSGIIPTLIAIFLIQILWFFGLHGQIIVNSVMDPIWNTLSLENYEAYSQGAEMPHIITKQFVDIYTVGIGGTGMTLTVVLTILFFLKSKQLKQVSKLAVGPGLFNVNEPVIFGLPIVMNPLIIVPWVVAPMVVTLITYFAMYTGIVPPPNGIQVPWTMPLFFSGMMGTGSLRGGLLQLFNMAVVFVIWFPFLKFIDRMNVRKEQEEEISASTKEQTVGM
ncbi:PTS cellobiose transporter subunit IIC [Paenibacillus medicaginis]|uniref:Permease IIC component n=1 Tax=Paenibacillus medicaginis TaxID=1470560 RepID=A0ABV5C8E8_9BACL